MCFTTEESAKGKKAKKDIKCWKVIRTNNCPVYIWVHGNKEPYVENNKMPVVKIENMYGVVYMGYHSSKIKTGLINTALESSDSIDRKLLKICKFIIPAGTRYFENETEYVSETIMLVE